MISIRIGAAERTVEDPRDIEASWIHEQLDRRRNDGQHVCVVIKIRTQAVDIFLSTPTCTSSEVGGGRRAPNPDEERIIELWNQRELGSTTFTGGNIIAFLRQIDRFL